MPKKRGRKKQTDGIKRPIDFPRHRKTKEELSILNMHFKKNKEWTRGLIEDLCIHLKMSSNQVYKWYYDKLNYKPRKNFKK